MTVTALGGARRWWRTKTATQVDVWLYAASAGFAVVITIISGASPEWHWGVLAFGPFVLCAVLSAVGGRLPRDFRLPWRWLVLGIAICGVVLAPLSFEVETRVAPNRSLGQPEERVIYDAAVNITKGKSPYTTYVNSSGRLVDPVPGIPAFQSFFPYFPLMGVFGVWAAVTGHNTGLTDARVLMTLFTLLVMGLALVLLRAPPERKLRTAQFLVALPTGAMFLATGGDDMPILALCLLALVFVQRHRPVATGVALGLAAAMKLTAWPFALVMLAVSFDKGGRRSWRTVLATMGAIVAVVVTPYIITGPRAFIANVFAFPLGMAGVASPAASPLPGHLLNEWFPALRHVLMPAVLVLGSVVLWRYLRTRWPLDLPRALRVLAAMMTVVICTASATRIGYVIYPIDFLVWAWVCTVPAPTVSPERRSDRTAASTWSTSPTSA